MASLDRHEGSRRSRKIGSDRGRLTARERLAHTARFSTQRWASERVTGPESKPDPAAPSPISLRRRENDRIFVETALRMAETACAVVDGIVLVTGDVVDDVVLAWR